MESRCALLILLISSLILFSASAAKNADLYKVLGVDRKATQREIQKAFHKLSLKYHPDKNKDKGAQEKFSEINNAYDILSDEQKRKNYDMYGDEKGHPGFEAGPHGNQGGYTFFTGGGQSQNRYNMGQSRNFQNMGGGSKSFSFSFGGSESSGGFDSFDFGLGDMFSNLFGGSPQNGGQFGGSKSGSNFKSSFQSGSKSIRSLNSQIYQTEVVDKGMTWLFLSRTSSMKGVQNVESIVEAVAQSLKGALKVGSINCEMERSLCKELGISSSRTPKVFVYSYQASGKASLVEYGGDWSVKDLISFCHKHLPKLSRRVQLNRVDFSSLIDEKLATVMFIYAKRDSPVVWQVLSGLYHKRFHFYDAQVPDASDPRVQELGVYSLPVVVGWLSNGEKHILKKGSSLNDLKSAVHELSAVLDSFEKMNKKVASKRAKNQQTKDSSETKIPLLSASNFDAVCGENTPVCIIGAFRSSRSKDKLEAVLKMVSQKTLSRRQSSAVGAKDSLSYCLLDAGNQAAFLSALENSSDKSLDRFLVAYKPRKNKFAVFRGDTTMEEVEGFVGSVLSGDIRFTKARRKPVIS